MSLALYETRINHVRMASQAWRQSADLSGMFLRWALLSLRCERLRFKFPPRLSPHEPSVPVPHVGSLPPSTLWLFTPFMVVV